MQSNTRSPGGAALVAADAAAGYDAGSGAVAGVGGVLVAAESRAGYDGADATEQDLAGLFADLRTAERAMASAVRRAGRLAGSGVSERVEGGALDWAISMACRMTGADARTLVGAGELLAHLPTVDRLFADGAVSWGQVRRITAAARRLTVAQRAVLDAQVAAAVEAYEGIDAFDPDHLCDAVDLAAEDLRGARERERQERNAARDNFLVIQGRTDGGSTGYWSGDAIGTAPILNAITAARPVPVATPDGERQPGEPTRQGAQQFAALHDIAAEYLAGTNSDLVPAAATDPDESSAGAAGAADAGGTAAGPGQHVGPSASGAGPDGHDRGTPTRHPLLPRRRRRRQARPLLTAHVDISQFHIDPTGVIELNVPGALPRVSAALVEVLARDADFQAVLFDGKRPLTVSRKLRANDIPADVRTAVAARDMGDRWPGSRAPITRTEPQPPKTGEQRRWESPEATSGCRAARRGGAPVRAGGDTHRRRSADATARFTRRGRTWRSLPRDTGLPPPSPPGDPPGDPPDPPPPPGLPF